MWSVANYRVAVLEYIDHVLHTKQRDSHHEDQIARSKETTGSSKQTGNEKNTHKDGHLLTEKILQQHQHTTLHLNSINELHKR